MPSMNPFLCKINILLSETRTIHKMNYTCNYLRTAEILPVVGSKSNTVPIIDGKPLSALLGYAVTNLQANASSVLLNAGMESRTLYKKN
jgi:hypothetical protein